MTDNGNHTAPEANVDVESNLELDLESGIIDWETHELVELKPKASTPDERKVTVIPTGISPEYVKAWNTTMAIREILQNYLDSKDEFDCTGSITFEKGLAKVKDDGPGLQVKHLAMGISEKGVDAIGKFGEGLKLALLVMARENRDIEVWSNGKIIIPVIEYSNDYQTDTLTFHLKDMYPRHAAKFTGTSIKFRCTRDELKEGKSYFIELSKKTGIEWLVKDAISLPGGRVYINGAAVGAIENARFSYHIRGAEGVTLGNRDRSTIDQDDLNPIVKRLLANSRSMKVISTILQDMKDARETYETDIGVNTWRMDKTDRKLWKRAVTLLYGKNTLLSSGSEEADTQAQYRGFKVISTGYKWDHILKEVGMKTVKQQIKPKKKRVKLVALKDLTMDERSVFDAAKRLVSDHYAKPGRIAIAESLQGKSGMAEGNDAAGLWCASEGKIYMKRIILRSLEETLHTLLHETVHKETGTDDCTTEFERALADVAVAIMLKGEKHHV